MYAIGLALITGMSIPTSFSQLRIATATSESAPVSANARPGSTSASDSTTSEIVAMKVSISGPYLFRGELAIPYDGKFEILLYFAKQNPAVRINPLGPGGCLCLRSYEVTQSLQRAIFAFSEGQTFELIL